MGGQIFSHSIGWNTFSGHFSVFWGRSDHIRSSPHKWISGYNQETRLPYILVQKSHPKRMRKHCCYEWLRMKILNTGNIFPSVGLWLWRKSEIQIMGKWKKTILFVHFYLFFWNRTVGKQQIFWTNLIIISAINLKIR